MATVSNELTTAIKRKRGELNITVVELARQTGVSRWTLNKIFKGKTNEAFPTTIAKLNEWLYKQM